MLGVYNYTQGDHVVTADAAAQRFAHAPADEGAEEAAVGLLAMHNVPHLVQLVIKHVSGRICDSRVPLVGLQVSYLLNGSRRVHT